MTATFEDVILQSQPAFYRDGAEGAGTVGKTWMWVLESPEGLDADWSGVDFECEILSPVDYESVVLVITLTADDDNRLTIYASAADTADAFADLEQTTTYPWRAAASKGVDAIAMWVAANSEFTVYPDNLTEGS